jgi:Zn-dependent protease with chaperone function
MDFFDRQEASHRATRYLVVLFGFAFLAVGLATGVALLVALGIAGSGAIMAGSPEVFAGAVAVVIAFMIIASLVRSATLSRGGGHVARALGGTRVQSNNEDPLHRRLLNVVEEMAIASGLPVPEVYVLESESGINAFAAGLTPADAAVAVTRGSLEQLNRAELQGVIAHEFSHILNGDMRLNLRLMGFSFGILVLSLAGRFLLRASGRGIRMRVSRRSKGSAAPILIGLALTIIGGIGVLLSRLIKAAVSRQREVLADASAVQFTREPLALAGALKKIGGYTPYLKTVETEEVSHMLFGRAGRSFTGMFATHPPLPERIKALDPTFKEGDYILPASEGRESVVHEAAVSQLSGQPADIGIETAGTISPAAGSALRAAIPADVADAAHSSQSAWLLVLALGLEPGGGSAVQRRLIENQVGGDRAARCLALQRQIEALPRSLRLPLFELAVPALKARPPEEIDFLFELLEKLADADGDISLFEYLLGTLLRAYFYPAEAVRSSSARRVEAMQVLLAVLAAQGHDDNAVARKAFSTGLDALGMAESEDSNQIFARSCAATDYTELDGALTILASAPADERRQALLSLAVTMRHDKRTTLEEAELFRVIAATLGCPVPPTGMIG